MRVLSGVHRLDTLFDRKSVDGLTADKLYLYIVLAFFSSFDSQILYVCS